MKKHFLLSLLFTAAITLFAQQPAWVNDSERSENYPRDKYLTGFAINAGNNTAALANELKASAKAELIENIQVSIQNEKINRKSEGNGYFSENYVSTTRSFADAEINGLKIDYYYDSKEQMGYAFAYADRNEIRRCYTEKIALAVRQIENAIADAQQLEADGSKGRAKKMYEGLAPSFEDLRFAQSLLLAIGSDYASTQIETTLSLQSAVTKAIVQMQSAIIVYVKSSEKNFDRRVQILEPKLKALLSQHGCSFTTDITKADWKLDITASTRKGREVDGIFFSYLDVTVSLTEERTGKEIYGNNFTDLKGGGLDYETAGRKAYDAGLKNIADAIAASIEK
jgi:hypothetical protein